MKTKPQKIENKNKSEELSKQSLSSQKYYFAPKKLPKVSASEQH